MELVLSGFIFQEKMWTDEDLKGKSYINIPLFDHHHDSHNERPSPTVQRNTFSFLPEDVIVLSSCNGLICCRSCGFLTSPTTTTLYICNPTNRQWISLDCPHYNRFDGFAFAFDPHKDPIDISTKFNLVRVKQDLIDAYEMQDQEIVEDEDGRGVHNIQYCTYFEIYSSETKSWKKSDKTCIYNHEVLENVPGIYIKGVLHWQADNGPILTFDLEKESCLVIPPPTSFSGFRVTCIGEWEGIFHYVMISKQGIYVWYLEDYIKTKWKLKVLKSLGDIGSKNPKFNGKLKKHILQGADSGGNLWVGLSSFKDGVLLVNLDDVFYLYNIEKNMVIEVCSHGDLSPKRFPCLVLPHCISLVPVR